MFLPDPETGRKYDHLMQAKKGGANPSALIGPAMPTGAEYIWNLWFDCHEERQIGLSVHLLRVRDIINFMGAYNIKITPFEIDCIIAIDREFVKANGHRKPSNKSNGNGT